jgi:hypothetical protein
MPDVTACPRPKGSPIARTKSPTSSEPPSLIRAAVRLSGLICGAATSVGLSRPTRCARNLRPSFKVTSMMEAPRTTCSLVRTYPCSAATMTPEPTRPV